MILDMNINEIKWNSKKSWINNRLRNIFLADRPFKIRTLTNIKTIGDLLCWSAEDLIWIRDLGNESLLTIVKTLEEMGFKIHIGSNPLCLEALQGTKYNNLAIQHLSLTASNEATAKAMKSYKLYAQERT